MGLQTFSCAVFEFYGYSLNLAIKSLVVRHEDALPAASPAQPKTSASRKPFQNGDPLNIALFTLHGCKRESAALTSAS
jgi:hypothetical protein